MVFLQERTFLAGQEFARQVSQEIASHTRRERDRMQEEASNGNVVVSVNDISLQVSLQRVLSMVLVRASLIGTVCLSRIIFVVNTSRYYT